MENAVGYTCTLLQYAVRQFSKSSATCLHDYTIGDQAPDIFIFLHIRIMKGRETKQIQQLQAQAQARLKTFIQSQLKDDLPVQQRLLITELDPAYYTMLDYS